jgi:hypothetical protein
MATTERHAVISHAIGPNGTVSIRTVRGSVRVRGTDRDEAHVEARYAYRGDEAADPEQDGVLNVTRKPGELRIEVDETSGGLGTALGVLLRGSRPAVDFDVTMPRGAVLRLAGVSADLDVRGVRGAQEIRTVSGDVSMDDVAGRISVQAVSGDVLIRGAVLSLDGSTTSGDLSAVAERFESVRARSVSGDLRLNGRLDPAGEHAIESISGDLELYGSGGMTVRMTAISGSINSELPHRREPNGGRRAIVVGDGSATVSFRTMSGDLNVMRATGSGAPEPPISEASPMRPPDPPRPTASMPPAPPSPPTPLSWPIPPSRPSGSGAFDDETTPPAGTPVPRVAVDELSILQALERGEIDVDEAARQLEGARSNA